MKVLVIDDEPEFILLLSKAFSKSQFAITTASSAEEAFDRLKTHEDIQAIVSDIKMPGLSGVEFFHEIKKRGYDISPFVFLTGYNQTDYNFLLEQGVDKIFDKPTRFQDIVTYVEEFVESQAIE